MIALPLAIVWFGAILLASLDGTRKGAGYLAVAILAAALGATVVLGVDVYQHGDREMAIGGWEPGIGIALRVDMLGIVFTVLSLVVLICALWFEVSRDVKARIFPSLVLFMAVGLIGLCFTGDVFNFYVFFEISMISAYVMASYGETPRQFRAALIFIVVNLLGSVLFLIGIAAIYHTTGWLDMERIAERMPIVAENPAILSSTIIFVAFGIKLGLFPFHFWLPAVYTGTRPAVAAILSGALANIGSYGLRCAGNRPPNSERGARLFRNRTGRLHPDRDQHRWAGRLRRRHSLCGSQRPEQGAPVSFGQSSRLGSRSGIRGGRFQRRWRASGGRFFRQANAVPDRDRR
jgi:multicomponent Na+:H+ antiporter subunit D